MSQIQQQLQRAQHLYAQGQYPQAETVFRQVLGEDPACREALEFLVAICLQSRRPQDAQALLEQLVTAYPDEPLYCDRLANLLERRGKPQQALACYRHLLVRQPRLVESHYNFARLLKRLGHYTEALQYYQQALELGISRPEEVYSNISVIHSDQHRHQAAQLALQQALNHNPVYSPALYNLALLHEEQGDWEQAQGLLQRVLELEPTHTDALVRLAQGQTHSDPDDPLLDQLQRVLNAADGDSLDTESLYFGLAKVYDDCRLYDAAFDNYRRANQLSRARVGAYDRSLQEALVTQLMEAFPGTGLAPVEPLSDAAPVFICGMFRSGSTLFEQVLAGHPQLVAGGELNFFRRQAPLPAALQALDQQHLCELRSAYLQTLAQDFPGAARVCNKRPDNFLYLGLIRAMFPNARIINTQRQSLDVCLSVYFQQFEAQLSYANSLEDIGHYYCQYQRLMRHWQASFPDNIMQIDYDQLVQEPRAVVEPVLEFLGLEWHEDCLEFQKVDNRVRTASVSQVRQPLYQHASGRWRNYEAQLGPLRDYLAERGI